MGAGQADVLVVATQSDLDLTRYCFRCHSHWAGRLRTAGRANWATQVPGRDFRSDKERKETELDLAFNYVKPKDKSFVHDLV